MRSRWRNLEIYKMIKGKKDLGRKRLLLWVYSGGLSTGGLDVFCAADVHAGAHQAARDALHRRAGMSHT